jgi:hypothetical protein
MLVRDYRDFQRVRQYEEYSSRQRKGVGLEDKDAWEPEGSRADLSSDRQARTVHPWDMMAMHGHGVANSASARRHGCSL